MPHYKYFILGGGMAADAAVKSIRQIDESGSIGLVSMETDLPYKRPPLTKGLWKGKPEDSIWLHTQDYGVTFHLGQRIQTLDPNSKRLIDDAGTEFTFDKLLMATGGTPRRLPFDSERIIYYRTFKDYRQLRTLAETGEHFLVIGGGFIGSEIAASLAMNNKNTTLIFPDDAIGTRIYPKELSEFLNNYYQEQNVDVITKDSVTEMETRGNKVLVKTQNKREFEVDGVVVGIGIVPNTELAEDAGLNTNNGIIVNNLLQSNFSDIYAAGDVANFYNPILDKRMRVEHEDNAVMMGKYVGANMAGENLSYDYLPYFYSDLFDLGYEAVGQVDSRLEISADWKEPFKEGVVYYVADNRVRGVLLWNVWDKVDAARDLIAAPGPLGLEEMRERIAA